ncbi:MAG: MarR family transcriptional regulator [Limnothrix sp. RL_2_0]|nr:MarR family transcriptional regulator [Limnothrix sp. RL_2_0]
MAKRKINGKFYAFTDADLTSVIQLRASEKDVFLYLRLTDPFGDGCEVIVSAIAERLKRTKSTITRALNVLKEKGLVNFEFTSCKAKVDGRSSDEPEHPPATLSAELPPEPDHAPEEPPSDAPENQQIHTGIDRYAQESTDTHRNRPIRTGISEEPEPAQAKASKSPKTYSNYLKLLKTLSDKEQRERFLNFCQRKAAELPQPVRMLDKWIYKNFDFLKAQFQQETGENIGQEQSDGSQSDHVSGQGFAVRKPKKKKNSLAPEVVELLKQAIAAKKIKNFWYCEPLKRWMVLLNNSQQVEVDIYIEREAMTNHGNPQS